MTATTNTIALLERYKDVLELPSDYAAAKRLGLSKQAISLWRKGGTMDDTTALQIAEELGIDRLATIAQVRLDRPTTARERKVWERYCARVFLATLVTATGVMGGPDTTYCRTLNHTEVQSNVYYVK